jgi:hypothetical protein
MTVAQYEVTFSVFKSNEPGKASIGSSTMTNLKTVVEATSPGQARAMVEAQYGSNCKTYGARPL